MSHVLPLRSNERREHGSKSNDTRDQAKVIVWILEHGHWTVRVETAEAMHVEAVEPFVWTVQLN